jgi:hypothetical protein
MKRILGLALAFGLGLLPSAFAQGAKGSIYGKVADESDAALPGSQVTLTGATIGAQTTHVTNQGDFRFLNLDPGTYTLTVALAGFGGQSRDVIVNAGVNVDLKFTLKVASVEETVVVTSETPVVDTKKTGTSTTLTREELAGIPNSRDPWAVLRTVPGVLVDRVNIAGSESGQQSQFIGKGSVQADTLWTLDGVVINDVGAAGSSPTYFDYDAFDEINVSTGGSDIKVASGGLGLNFVTKRGTNAFHGGVGGYLAHDKLQSGNVPDDLAGDARLGGSDKADHADQIADYGAEIGGPIVKDRLWFFGSYGKQDIRIVRLNQTLDKTLLEDYTGKVNWQATQNDMLSLLYFRGSKLKFGRFVGGLGVNNEQDSFLRDQGNGGKYPLYGIANFEWNHVFNPNFFANVKLSRQNTGFSLTPRGGLDLNQAVDQVGDLGSGSSDYFNSVRPQHSGNADFNYFRSGMGGNHEFKFGFGFRKASVTSSTLPPGNQIRALNDPSLGGQALIRRSSISIYGGDYTSAYVGDTFTKGRFTLNVGARFDRQRASNKPSEAPANASFPELLPALQYDGSGASVEWTDISPRVGFTYALGEDHKTLVRGSYSRYSSLLPFTDATLVSPLGGVGVLQYGWTDRNGDGFATRDEVDIAGGQTAAPVNAALSTVNAIDPDYTAAHDNEFTFGIEREMFANFAVGVTGTWRRSTDLPWTPFLGIDNTMFVPQAPRTRNGFTVNPFDYSDEALDAAAANGFGQLLTNRPGYSRLFKGVELTATKRMANKWMARVAFSYNDWTEHFDNRDGIQNPTPVLYDLYGLSPVGQTITTDANVDGGLVASFGAGSGKVYWVNAKWQANASAMYQLPAGFEIAGNLYARQGYPQVTTISAPNAIFCSLPVIASPIGDRRTPNLVNLDFRVAKKMKIGGNASLDLTADVFNVLNSGTVLLRNGSASSAVFNRIDEILAPRIARLGVRLGF